jgi:amino acid transporter
MRAPSAAKLSNNGTIGLWEAVSMAVGTMIGASIFSIFGVGAEIAGQNLPEAFLLSGLYAFIVAYSYAKLGTKIISIHGIGDGVVTGALSVLMWLTYVVSIAMFAKGFAGYFLPLFKLNTSPTNRAVLEVLIIVFFTVLNFFGSKAVGKTEFYIVLVKLSILMVFISFGISRIRPSYIQPRFDSPHLKGMFHASVIFFLSYMGFGLITNASENIKNASKNIPRAIYISVAIVLFIYITIAASAEGNLSQAELLKAKENALAIAAQPFLGHFGFLLISIGALFSISSALNATLYGGANISYSLAKDGDLPDFFERKIWFKSVEGLYITAALSAAFALFFNMSGIAAITSSIFTLIYMFVLVSHFRLRREVGGNRTVLRFNIFLLAILFLSLLYFQFLSQKTAFFGTFAVIVGAVMVEASFRFLKKRSFSTFAPKGISRGNDRRIRI